jgi:hypothetical protein
MDLERAIHERWAAAAGLAAILPAERFTTGLAHAAGFPYATCERTACRTLLRTSSGDAVDEADLTIRVRHEDYDAGRAIAEQVKAAFDRSDFPLTGGDRAIQMRCVDDSARQHDDGAWEFLVAFRVQVHLAQGV